MTLRPALAMIALLLPFAAVAQSPTKKPVAPTQDKADLDPMIAAQSKARAKALKAKKAKPAPKGKQVDLNSATKEELMKLPGITGAYADKIIAKRPFLSKIHLMTKDVLPYALYESIKGRIVAKQAK